MHALISRRGLASLVAAPAIVRVTSIMPVKAWRGTEAVIELLDGELDEDPVRDYGIQLGPERACERALIDYWQQRDERVVQLYLHDRMLRARGQRRA